MLASNNQEDFPSRGRNSHTSQGSKMLSTPIPEQKSRRCRPRLLFVNKNATSSSLSHSEGSERIKLLSMAQRTSRIGFKRKTPDIKPRLVRKHEAPCSCGFISCQGCNELQESRARTRSPFDALYDISDSLSSAVVNRVQLTALFLESYYPIGMPAHTEIVNKLLPWIQPTRGALALAAADSMIALHAAHVTNNHRLREEGMHIYQTALRLLRDELINSASAKSDGVLGAVEILAVAETRLLKSSNEDCGDICRAHARGLYALFVTRGPSILQSDIGRNIFLHHLHEPLMVSLLARKASVFGNAEWQAAFEDIDGQNSGKMHRLTSLGCCIPTAFEKADGTINNAYSTSHQYSTLLDDLKDLEMRLMEWLENRIGKSSHGRAYWTTTASPSFFLHGNGTIRQSHFPFAPIIEYHSFLDALAHINYWGLLLMLRKTIFDVLNSYQSIYPALLEPFHLSTEEILGKCNETADHVCQSAFYICGLPKPQSTIAKQGMVAFLIAVILPWYVQVGDMEKIIWCKSLIKSFQMECEELDLVESAQQTWTTKLYIGWINMAF